jgi:hypothetical protein
MWNGAQTWRLQGTWTPAYWYSHANANLTLVPNGTFVQLVPNPALGQIINATGFLSTCTTLSPLMLMGAMQEIVNDQVVYPVVADEMRYADKTTAYTTMKTDTTLKEELINSNPVFETFYNTNEAGNIGQISRINDLINQQDYAGALASNSAFIPANLIEQNRKSVNDVYLNTWAKERFTFTDDEYQTLYNLAIQRPVIAGDAVYSARVMLGVEGLNMESARMVNPENSNAVTPSIGKIYPNPAKDEAYLDYQLKDGQQGVIYIYSITGQLLFEKALANDNNRLVISTSNFNNGLYFYRIIVDKAVVANEKLMIIK